MDVEPVLEAIIDKSYLCSLDAVRAMRKAVRGLDTRRSSPRAQRIPRQLGVPGSSENDLRLSDRYFHEFLLPGRHQLKDVHKFFDANERRVRLNLSDLGLAGELVLQLIN